MGVAFSNFVRFNDSTNYDGTPKTEKNRHGLSFKTEFFDSISKKIKFNYFIPHLVYTRTLGGRRTADGRLAFKI